MTVRSTVIATPTLLSANGTPDASTIRPRVAGVTTSRLWIERAASLYRGAAATCK